MVSIVKECDLLHIEEDNYAFERHRFCEYLAAERIDRDALVSSYLQTLDVMVLPLLKETFAFCYAMRLQSGVSSSGQKILEGLLLRARQSSMSVKDSGDPSLSLTFEWLKAAIYCAAAGAEIQNSEIRRFEEYSGSEQVLRGGIDLLRAHHDHLPPKERDEVLSGIMALCRVENLSKTISSVHRTIAEVTSSTTEWQVFPSKVAFPDEDTTANYKVAGWPLLVCEYEAFVREHTSYKDDLISAGVWDHAPADYAVTIDTPSMISSAGRSGTTIWREMRKHLARPMTMITWYEAVAYAQWLTIKLQKDAELRDDECVRLPTRYEMQELQIRCAEGGQYPWGDALRGNCGSVVNYRDSGVNGVSSVGTFPTHKGYADLGSNVQVWTINTDQDGFPIWPPKPHTDIDTRQPTMGASWYHHDQ